MNFEILIPVWGEPYIAQFAQFGLRSLLAPGNVPWLGQNHRVQATILTSSSSRSYVDAQPAFRRLAELVPMQIVEIDDLLAAYGGNYSVILTRAYNRAMALNRDMLGTVFIYLVGDLVFADGSMRTLAKVIENGANACVMCSPRVSAQALTPILNRIGSTIELTIPNRHMANLLLEYPHPTLVAKEVRNDHIHLSIVHQFFWRPNPDVMVSRCFLAHMLGIKPTCRPRDIAAPCDFSFLEELAPGAPYHFLTDSDAFLALEMQDAFHECKYITTFPLAPHEVAEGIASWSTDQHHRFIEATFVFRGGTSDYSEEDGRKLTQSYVDEIKALVPAPMDQRHHFFWLGANSAPVVTRQWDEAARERDLDRIPLVLRRLIEGHIEKLSDRRLELAICAASSPSPVEALLTVSARVTARISPKNLYGVVEDIVGPGAPTLLVLWGTMEDFLDLFGTPARIYRLLRVAGRDRTMLLCFEISRQTLRDGRPSRDHLNELFASSFATFARFGLRTRVHDLASSVFDDTHGLVIEVLSDETIAPLAGRFYPDQDDLLFGNRSDHTALT